MKFKTILQVATTLLALWLTPLANHAVTIIQSTGAQFLAWEAEDTASISNLTPAPTPAPALFVTQSDATATGGKALYAQGPDQNTSTPGSFATYKFRFKTPGTYNLYVRWRADATRSTQDVNGANSYYLSQLFGDTDADVTHYNVTAANNSRVPPAANNYEFKLETTTFEVTQADVDAGTEFILKIGSREWGMFIDRFVLSQDATLTDVNLNGLPDSATSLITQGTTDAFVAFEAENASALSNLTPAPTVPP